MKKRLYIVRFRGHACKTVTVIFSNGVEIMVARHQAISLGMDQ